MGGSDCSTVMLILGVTGSFGTGKTTVCQIFKELGAEVIDADKISHNILEKGDIQNQVKELFNLSLQQSAQEFRSQIAQIAFKDRKSIKKLEKILHPLIIKEIKEKISQAKEEIVVVDAPLLIETGLDKIVDKLIVVSASLERQISRGQKENFSHKEVLERIECQIPLSEKLKQTDFIIDNDGEIEKTKEQVKEIYKLCEAKPQPKASPEVSPRN